MSWRVRQGKRVAHDHQDYTGGQDVPCTNAQAAAMTHAVEWVEPMAMKADVPVAAVETKKRTK